jgi:hypothetical protein
MAFSESFWHSTGTPAPEIRKLENLHVALWLLKDVSWCSEWHALGMIASIPTILLATRIFWMGRESFSEVAHNGAICLWICANITWMIGEFFYQDQTRGYAKIFFFAGAALLILYYLWSFFANRPSPGAA